jgi:hypothetical protein
MKWGTQVSDNTMTMKYKGSAQGPYSREATKILSACDRDRKRGRQNQRDNFRGGRGRLHARVSDSH